MNVLCSIRVVLQKDKRWKSFLCETICRESGLVSYHGSLRNGIGNLHDTRNISFGALSGSSYGGPVLLLLNPEIIVYD